MKKRHAKSFYYCLTFTIEFEFENDTVYIAYSNPYPYSSIISNILSLEMQLKDNNDLDK